jgi:hypothetical protein
VGDKNRMDMPDTVDQAIHFLQKLQAEGWGLKKVEFDIDYGKAHHKGVKMPVSATLEIKLLPQ